jgi:transposase
VSGNGVPLAAVSAAASVGETRLVEPLLERLIEAGGPHVSFWPQRIIGDKGYDSDQLREVLRAVDIELLSPHRENRTAASRSNDGRKMRRYKRRWRVERFFAWAGGFRRFIVRYERLRVTLDAVVNAVCLLITMRFL